MQFRRIGVVEQLAGEADRKASFAGLSRPDAQGGKEVRFEDVHTKCSHYTGSSQEVLSV